MKPCSSYLILTFTLTAGLAHAGWREDVGYFDLLGYNGYYGNSLPSGASTTVELIEAPNSNGDYMPNVGDSRFSGKTITNISNTSSGTSGHATSVGALFFGNTYSLSPDTETIGVRDANHFLSTFIGSPVVGSTNADVISHAYISYQGSNSVETIKALLARFDFFCIDSDVVNVVGVANGANSAIPPIWGSNYNAISVGRTDGLHSHGLTNTTFENDAGSTGRQKPDLVAPLTSTSNATGATAGAAKLIRDKALSSGNSDASHPDTIKASLLAGATKDEFPNWSQTEARPLDSTFGAGELNIYNSYRIIEEAESSTGNVSHRGWARNSVTTSGNPNNQVRTYTFTTPNYPAGEIRLSAALIWQREVSNLTYSYQSLDNLRLELLDSNDSLIQASDSSEDNVEHIWNTGLQPNTTYSLQVTSNSGSSAFSLAWHVDFAPANPVLTALSRNPSDIQLSFLNLQPNLDYYVQRSTTFSETSWSNIAPLVPTTSSDSYTDNSPPGTDKVFYRLLPLLP